MDVWVYEDATNPWDGKVVAMAADTQGSLDAIEEFLTASTQRVRDGDLDHTALASIETALYEHFYTLVDLAKDMQYASSSESMKTTADRIFELNANMQDLLNLVSKQRKSAAGDHSSAAPSDQPALSDPFLDMYDELIDTGYSPAAFDRWLELARSEESPGTAYEAIASYMLFQPQDTTVFPLNLAAAFEMLERAGTASATVLHTIVRMAVFRNETASVASASAADSLLRTHATTNFLARMVLAARLQSRATTALSDDDPCEEAVAYYYTSAEDSVQDMVDAGGEKEMYEPMVRLSEAWMGMHGSSDDLLDVPSNGMDALDYVRSLALGGNPEAVHRLGEMHFFGDAQAGLAPNPAEALRHFEEAAANGVTHSLANLGLMYANGMGVEPNPERAVQYFQQAADRGNAFAVNGLGYMYWTGQGVAKNATKAVAFFQKAVGMGFSDAHQYLGAAYLDGDGVDQNNTLAFYHFSIAANESDSRQAHFNLGIMHYKGLGTRRSCPLAVRAFRTVAWRAAYFDDVLLSPELGHEAFARGDLARSLLHYSIWALVGVPQAACNAGFLLDQIHTQPFDTTPPLQLAKVLYESAGSDPEALRKLGHCHRDGWDLACSVDAPAALEYYAQAGALHDSEALYSAGMLHTILGNWDLAHDAWQACTRHEYPTNIPCLLPALALDVWTGLTWVGASVARAWSLLHDTAVFT